MKNSPKNGDTLAKGKVKIHEYDGFALSNSPRRSTIEEEKDIVLAPSYVKFYKYEEIKDRYQI